MAQILSDSMAKRRSDPVVDPVETGQDGFVDDELLERVLIAVESIPRGKVASYGDIARLVGTGPRQVGNIMRLHGSGVPWWRVTNSYGDLPGELHNDVRVHWADEDIIWKANGLGCRIADYRTDLSQLNRDLNERWQRVLREHRRGGAAT